MTNAEIIEAAKLWLEIWKMDDVTFRANPETIKRGEEAMAAAVDLERAFIHTLVKLWDKGAYQMTTDNPGIAPVHSWLTLVVTK